MVNAVAGRAWQRTRAAGAGWRRREGAGLAQRSNSAKSNAKVTRPTRRIAPNQVESVVFPTPRRRAALPNALKTKSLEGVPFPSNHLSVEETYQTT